MTTQVAEILFYDNKELCLSPFPEVPFDHPRIVFNPFVQMALKFSIATTDKQESNPITWWDLLLRSARPEEIELAKVIAKKYETNHWAKAEIEELFQDFWFGFTLSSACRRNYIGKWVIVDGVLQLAHLSFTHGSRVIDGPDPIPANWISGTFVGQYGNDFETFRYGYIQKEYAKLLVFDAGRLVKYEDTSPEYIPPKEPPLKEEKFNKRALIAAVAIAGIAAFAVVTFLI